MRPSNAPEAPPPPENFEKKPAKTVDVSDNVRNAPNITGNSAPEGGDAGAGAIKTVNVKDAPQAGGDAGDGAIKVVDTGTGATKNDGGADTPTPASDAAARYKQETGWDALATGKIPTWKPFDWKGYAYKQSEMIGYVTDSTNAKSVMKILKDDPNHIFPFGVRNVDGTSSARITDKAVLDLVGAREFGLPIDLKAGPIEVGGGNRVVVEHVTDTQFTFKTLPGHFDGADNLISFRTYEKDGRIYLEQTAWAPNAGPVNATWSSPTAQNVVWPRQASNLQKAVQAADAVQVLYGR